VTAAQSGPYRRQARERAARGLRRLHESLIAGHADQPGDEVHRIRVAPHQPAGAGPGAAILAAVEGFLGVAVGGQAVVGLAQLDEVDRARRWLVQRQRDAARGQRHRAAAQDPRTTRPGEQRLRRPLDAAMQQPRQREREQHRADTPGHQPLRIGLQSDPRVVQERDERPMHEVQRIGPITDAHQRRGHTGQPGRLAHQQHERGQAHDQRRRARMRGAEPLRRRRHDQQQGPGRPGHPAQQRLQSRRAGHRGCSLVVRDQHRADRSQAQLPGTRGQQVEGRAGIDRLPQDHQRDARRGDRDGHAQAPSRRAEDQQGRQQQVVLLLQCQRPEVQQRLEIGRPLEVAGLFPQHDVAGEAQRAEQLTHEVDLLAAVERPRHGQQRRAEHDIRRGQQAARSPAIERPEAESAACERAPDQPGDEETRDDEEDVHAQVAARGAGNLRVIQQYPQHGDRAQRLDVVAQRDLAGRLRPMREMKGVRGGACHQGVRSGRAGEATDCGLPPA